MQDKTKMVMLVDFYGDLLTDKQREFMGFYYEDDLSLSEIAEHAGITRQGVWDAIKRGENVLIDMEERLKLVDRFKLIKSSVEEIAQRSTEIIKLSGNHLYSSDIISRAKRINELAANLSE